MYPLRSIEDSRRLASRLQKRTGSAILYSITLQPDITQKGDHQMKHAWIAFGLCVFVAAAGCSSERAEIKEDRLTVGKVQGEIKVGMPASQVAELLGSPNIVTTD